MVTMAEVTDFSVLAERIIRDLKTIFKRDTEIVEFDIIPVDKKLINKSPVIHIDHRVGLESWCVKHVYKYAYENLLLHRENPRKELQQKVRDWTLVILLINPDLALAWNTRRDLVQSGFLKCDDEFHFSETVLSRKPKSPDNFAYREWLLKRLLASPPPQEVIDDAIRNELRVSLDTASRYQRNYHAWAHRIWVIDHFCSERIDIIEYDIYLTNHWVQQHISDYGGWQYRQYLFTCLWKIVDKDPSRRKALEVFLEKELDSLNGSASLYPDRESLFYHRRFILSKTVEWFEPRIPTLQKAEITFIEGHLSCAYSNRTHSTWQFELISRHVRWVRNVLKWELDPEKIVEVVK